MNNKKILLAAIATLTGTIIGAGFLGIPNVVSKSGFLIGLLHIISLGLIMLLINLYLGEVALRTRGIHQLPGYARKYLGRAGSIMLFFSMIFGIYTAVIAYFIGEGQALSFIFLGTTKNAILFSIAFFVLIAVLVYKGLSALKRGEVIGLIAVLLIITAIAIFFFPKIKTENLSYIEKSNFFLPYGVVLFSFLAFSSLPELERELEGKEKLMKKAIIIGSLIPIAVYILFTLAVVGYAGKATPEVATIALGKLPSLLAVFTMFTACFALSMALRDMYIFDLKFKKVLAWFLSCVIPFFIFLLVVLGKIAGFVKLLELSGSIAGGIAGIAITLMAWKAKKIGKRKPEYSVKLLSLIHI